MNKINCDCTAVFNGVLETLERGMLLSGYALIALAAALFSGYLYESLGRELINFIVISYFWIIVGFVALTIVKYDTPEDIEKRSTILTWTGGGVLVSVAGWLLAPFI